MPYFAVSGVVGIGINYLVWTTSVRVNGPAVATALLFSAPTFVFIGDRLFLGARGNSLVVAAIVIDLLGCALAAGINRPAAVVKTPAGLLIGMTNGLTFATYAVAGRGMTRRGQHESLTSLLSIFVLGAATLLVTGLASYGPRILTAKLSATGWLSLLALGLGPTLIGYGLFNSSLKHLSATSASVISTLEPPLVAILSYLLLHRSISILQSLGIALIVTGVMIMQLRHEEVRLEQESETGTDEFPAHP